MNITYVVGLSFQEASFSMKCSTLHALSIVHKSWLRTLKKGVADTPVFRANGSATWDFISYVTVVRTM